MENSKRKQIIQEYKEQESQAGVYLIRNSRNQKVFINSSMNLQTMNGQRFQLKMGSHMNRELQAEWKQFGEEAFEFEVVEVLDKLDERFDPNGDLKKLCALWMERLQPYGERGYHKP